MGLRPTQGNEKHSVRHLLSMEPLPFPCHPDRSAAERRDLRFRKPFVDMFVDRSEPGFPAGQHRIRPRVRLLVRKAA
jgi:hypothetical protein